MTPRLTEDGQINLTMDVEVSDVAAIGANNLPVVNRRTAQSTVRVQSGGTAAIGGLMISQTQTTNSRVPGFADVPGAGELFKNRNSSRISKQLAVFVTATLVEDRGGVLGPRRQTSRPIPPVDRQAFRAALAQSLRRLELETQGHLK